MKISVIVHPAAKHPRIETDESQCIHIYVHESAVDGKANKAVVDALATQFKVKRSQVRLVLGLRSKKKLFEILT